MHWGIALYMCEGQDKLVNIHMVTYHILMILANLGSTGPMNLC